MARTIAALAACCTAATAAAPRSSLAFAPLASLTTPCAVVDLAVAQRNANAMLERARDLEVELRPHVKTHKTVAGALLQTGGRRSRITVSTLAEAEHFAVEGFDDILYAVPLTPDKVPRVAALLAANTTIHVSVDNMAQLVPLLEYDGQQGAVTFSVVIMTDCG